MEAFDFLWAKEILQFDNTKQRSLLKCSENRSLCRKNMLRTVRKLATIAHRGGMCWHCIKCDAEVFEAQRVQVFCLCFLCSPAQITKALLRQAPRFFPLSQNKHTKVPVPDCNCPRLREPHVAVLWCTCLRNKLLCCAGTTTVFDSLHSRGKFIIMPKAMVRWAILPGNPMNMLPGMTNRFLRKQAAQVENMQF